MAATQRCGANALRSQARALGFFKGTSGRGVCTQNREITPEIQVT
tara:strand:- start:782 stop:916 length:135 start_codon:yes stop_codon:yes gene_type:complete